MNFEKIREVPIPPTIQAIIFYVGTILEKAGMIACRYNHGSRIVFDVWCGTHQSTVVYDDDCLSFGDERIVYADPSFEERLLKCCGTIRDHVTSIYR